ncbi:hypothetical protein N9Q06_00370 [bacterium]|nr:hypothetical protein [bacterium]
MTDRDELRRLIDVIEKASSSVQIDQAIEDIKTFSNTASFLANKLETRLKGGDVKAKDKSKRKPKSRIGKAIAPPPIPKPNVQQPQTNANSTANGMPSAASSATSQADYDRLKPQGSQGTISTS